MRLAELRRQGADVSLLLLTVRLCELDGVEGFVVVDDLFDDFGRVREWVADGPGWRKRVGDAFGAPQRKMPSGSHIWRQWVSTVVSTRTRTPGRCTRSVP